MAENSERSLDEQMLIADGAQKIAHDSRYLLSPYATKANAEEYKTLSSGVLGEENEAGTWHGLSHYHYKTDSNELFATSEEILHFPTGSDQGTSLGVTFELKFNPDAKSKTVPEEFVYRVTGDDLDVPDELMAQIEMKAAIKTGIRHVNQHLVPTMLDEYDLLGEPKKVGVIVGQYNNGPDERWSLGVGVEVRDGKTSDPFVYMTDGKEIYAEQGSRISPEIDGDDVSYETQVVHEKDIEKLPEVAANIMAWSAYFLADELHMQEEVATGRANQSELAWRMKKAEAEQVELAEPAPAAEPLPKGDASQIEGSLWEVMSSETVDGVEWQYGTYTHEYEGTTLHLPGVKNVETGTVLAFSYNEIDENTRTVSTVGVVNHPEGGTLLEWEDVPVEVQENVIFLVDAALESYGYSLGDGVVGALRSGREEAEAQEADVVVEEKPSDTMDRVNPVETALNEEQRDFWTGMLLIRTDDNQEWEAGAYSHIDEEGDKYHFVGMRNPATGQIAYYQYRNSNPETGALNEVKIATFPEGSEPIPPHHIPEQVRQRTVVMLESFLNSNGSSMDPDLKEALMLSQSDLKARMRTDAALNEGRFTVADPELQAEPEVELYRSKYTPRPDSALDEEEVELFGLLHDEVDGEAAWLAREHFREIASRQFFLKHDRDGNAALESVVHYHDVMENPPGEEVRNWAAAEEARNEARAAARNQPER